VVAALGSLAAHRKFEASLYLLSAAEGGRRTEIRTGYRPQFFVRTADVVGVMDLGPASLARPGDRVTVTVELGQPVAVDVGLGFAIREGPPPAAHPRSAAQPARERRGVFAGFSAGSLVTRAWPGGR
jgi:translation elongation factor EF-Tu-like GTPase